MSFTDHKITAFQHKVSDLPDEPQIPAEELKSRFDACPEELRQSLNAVCDDAARLEARVEGIVVDTFGDTIDKEMLSDELAAELDGKATQSALSAEVAARESADSALQSSISSVQTSLAAKCEVYIGSYTGNGASSRTISLDFTPRAVIVFSENAVVDNSGYSYGGVGSAVTADSNRIKLTGSGFMVYYRSPEICLNTNGMVYGYIAIK